MTPARAQRPCSVPGCPRLVSGRTAQCREHQREADERKGSPAQRGYDADWAALSRYVRSVYPQCQWPGCTRPSATVDHIDGNSRHNVLANLRALCWPHHNRRTGLDQPGGSRLT